MKKILAFLPFVLFANEAVPMPPMPPVMNLSSNKKTVVKKSTKVKNKLPDECKVIPPMLIFMPPPLENDLTKCKNKMFKPKLSYAKKIFAKKHLKVKSVNTVEGFSELYEIKTNKSSFYCNKNLSKCFKVSK